jgi:hypothetical protein
MKPEPDAIKPEPDAMNPDSQGVRTRWNQGFMAFPAGPAQDLERVR